MYRRVLNVLFLCVLAAAAAGTWYASRPAAPGAERDGAAAGAPPSYYMKDAVLLRTDESGRILYRVHAERATEKPGGGALELDDVRIEYREDERVPWRVRAGRAVAWLEQQALELGSGVELIRQVDGETAIVRTERLLLEPLSHQASADGEVRFVLGRNELVAEGLRAFLKEDRLELESKIHGRLQP